MLVTAIHGALVAVAVTERGLMLAALGQVWTAVYVAFFFRPAAARRYAALLIAVLGVSLLAARAPTDVSVWIIISAMVWVAVALLTALNERLRVDGAHRQPHGRPQPHRVRASPRRVCARWPSAGVSRWCWR